MRLPDFIIIGAAKSGTTTLYQYLCQHPQIYMSTPKEPEYFARDDIYVRGLPWYSNLFQDTSPHQVCGEASTLYTLSPYFPETAKRMASVIPSVKLIYIMRHPVDRAYSFYAQLLKSAQNTTGERKVLKTFEESLMASASPSTFPLYHPDPVNAHLPQCPGIYLDGSRYLFQIEQYLQFFPREAFLFLLLEDLTHSPQATLTQVCNFLGVDTTFDFPDTDPIVANTARSHNEWYLRSRVTAPLRAIPMLDFLASNLPQRWRDNVYEILKKFPYFHEVKAEYLPPRMQEQTRRNLIEVFRVPNQQLSQFLERDLSHWSV